MINGPEEGQKAAWFRQGWRWGLLAVLIVVLTYAPVWRAGCMVKREILTGASAYGYKCDADHLFRSNDRK